MSFLKRASSITVSRQSPVYVVSFSGGWPTSAFRVDGSGTYGEAYERAFLAARAGELGESTDSLLLLYPRMSLPDEFRILEKVSISGADLRGAEMNRAIMPESNLDGCKLDKADFSGTSLVMADIRGASAMFCNFRGADLTKSSFEGTNLYRADLRDCKVTLAYFRGANLRGADFSGVPASKMREASFEGSAWDSSTKWPSGFKPPPSDG